MAYRDIQIPPGSSNVQSVQYDSETGTLRVMWVRGGGGRYLGVTGDAADGFTTSGMSAGTYLNAYIKHQFVYEPGT